MQSLVAVGRRRTRKTGIDGRLGKEERSVRLLAAGFDDDRGVAASPVALAFSGSMNHRRRHTRNLQKNPCRVSRISDFGIDRWLSGKGVLSEAFTTIW
jgi:hypothetical protein